MSEHPTVMFLVALRRGNGSIERAPQPVNAAAVLDMMARLVPYQELRIAAADSPETQA